MNKVVAVVTQGNYSINLNPTSLVVNVIELVGFHPFRSLGLTLMLPSSDTVIVG